jgi:hypothetical protein
MKRNFVLNFKSNLARYQVNLVAFCLVGIAFFVNSCTKERNQSNYQLPSSDISTVKQLIESSKETYSLNSRWVDSLTNALDFAHIDMADFGFNKMLISIPIKMQVPRDFSIKGLSSLSANSRSFLLAYKNDDGSIQLGNIVQLTPNGNCSIGNSSQLVTALLHSANRSTDFSGYFTSFSLNKQVRSEMEVKGGVKTQYSEKTTKSNDNGVIVETSNCTSYYWVTTVTDENGNILSQTWAYIGTSCESLQQGGGAGGGGEITSACEQNSQANFQEELSGSAAVFVDGTPTESVIDNLTKYKNPKWKCLNGAGGWALWSQETGITKLITVATNVWSWQSLVHSGISMTGSTLIGTSVTFSQGFGTPSFVAGNYTNELYAGMSVDWTVTYSFVPKCPIINETIPSVTKDYNSAGFWSAIP